jgi:hypothetical protein
MQECVVAARKRNKEERHESAVGETQVHDHGVTPNDVMGQLKKVMTPWSIDFAGPLSWFAIWRGEPLSLLCAFVALAYGMCYSQRTSGSIFFNAGSSGPSRRGCRVSFLQNEGCFRD